MLRFSKELLFGGVAFKPDIRMDIPLLSMVSVRTDMHKKTCGLENILLY